MINILFFVIEMQWVMKTCYRTGAGNIRTLFTLSARFTVTAGGAVSHIDSRLATPRRQLAIVNISQIIQVYQHKVSPAWDTQR